MFKVADINKVSKRKASETIQPLFNKYEKPDEWRYVSFRVLSIGQMLILFPVQTVQAQAGHEKFANFLIRLNIYMMRCGRDRRTAL